ncbi:MAG: hypothetical protein QM576_17085 [Rhodopseudomonas sp.]|uniref:hypothetical protein n=1 Tax=Rhodopseudomonas sp. TaxID=1078 RepID=UPI0039E49756
MSEIEHDYHTPRKCEKCGSEMKLIGRLPRRLQHPARTVFRCAGCDNVVQE